MVDDLDISAEPPGREAGPRPVLEGPATRALYRLAARIAAAEAPVLILGETGTGKEVLATYIARESGRPLARMRTVNCAALPTHLLEAALFGHERGSFTGAVRSAPGLFEQASGGTVFLDEVGELSPAAQAALLRVLESGQISRIGSEREITVDTRIIAATNCDLEQMVEQGRFRRDLLYRLNTVTLDLLPLRERPDEILPLARHFLTLARARGLSLSHEVEVRLLRYSWPGNVRQLRNVIERAAILCEDGRIEPCHLPGALLGDCGPQPLLGVGVNGTDVHWDDPDHFAASSGRGLRDELRHYEMLLIERALASTGGNQSRAAVLLRIPRRTLVRKLRGS
jgi:two-component system response regulator AtoC